MSSEEVQTIIQYANRSAKQINAKIAEFLELGCHAPKQNKAADNVRIENGVVTHVRLKVRFEITYMSDKVTIVFLPYVTLGYDGDSASSQKYTDLGWIRISKGKITKNDIIVSLWPIIKKKKVDNTEAYSVAMMVTS